MKTHTLTIDGMSCDHCVMHVRKELSRIASVKEVRVGTAVVEIDESSVSADDLANAVSAAGYALKEIA